MAPRSAAISVIARDTTPLAVISDTSDDLAAIRADVAAIRASLEALERALADFGRNAAGALDGLASGGGGIFGILKTLL